MFTSDAAGETTHRRATEVRVSADPGHLEEVSDRSDATDAGHDFLEESQPR